MWFKRKSRRIVIEFTDNADGSMTTAIKVNKEIRVVDAIDCIGKLKFKWSVLLQKRIAEKNFAKKDIRLPGFVRGLKIKDIS